MLIAASGIFGALVGSFLNVVAYRLPRRESIVRPRSRCPACGVPIKPYDNVPVLSWLLLRGRCRSCKAPISPRYPAVEALSGALCLAVALDWSSAAEFALGISLVLVAIPIALIDLDCFIIPNVLVGAGSLLALVLGGALQPAGELARLASGAGAGAAFLAIVLAYPKGMGLGDAKLAAMLGLYLGLSVIPAILIALFTGTLLGVAVMARAGVARGRKTKVPFGPFLAFGAICALFVGQPVLHWYSGTFIH